MDDLSANLFRLISLQDSNTRSVLLGTTILGIASGTIGSFSVLRKRALIGDALSHAALPGICIAFILVGSKSTNALLLGALLATTVGILTISLLRSFTRIPEDSIIGIVLSTFFGAGIMLSSLIQQQGIGNISGIETFLYGKTAAMTNSDVTTILIISSITAIIAIMLFKEFLLLCFDKDFAQASGWPTTAIDLILMALTMAIVVVGLQAVGVVLVIALLITPAVTARLWTDNLKTMVIISAISGGISGFVGTIISALFPLIPTGPIIVIVAALLFSLSFIFAPSKGLVAKLFVSKEMILPSSLSNQDDH